MRRIGARAAVLASIVYTVLATWHGVLMQPPQGRPSMAEASLAASFERALKAAICHAGRSEMAPSEAAPDLAPPEPGSPQQAGDCPVCKGLASCQLVLMLAAELGLLAPPAAAVVFHRVDVTAAGRIGITPRSRGPPTLA